MRSPRSILTRLCLALTLSAAPALAGDFYVDVAGGNNANDGMTPATAWRNISFALANVPLTDPSGMHTLHVAPGTYSTANGETFPLEVEAMTGTGAANIEIISDAGSGATTLSSPSTTVLIRSRRLPNDGPFFRSRITRVEGFTITTGSSAVVVTAIGGNLAPTLVDLVLQGGGLGTGMRFSSVGDSFVGTSGDINNATVTNCDVSGFGVGAVVSGFGDLLIFTSAEVTFTDTVIHGNNSGLSIDAEDSESDANLSGCRIVGNSGTGVSMFTSNFNFGDTTINATETVIANNGFGGIQLSGIGFGFGGPFVNLERCTVADNIGPGIESFEFGAELDANTSILFGNSIDIEGDYGSRTVEYSNVGSGDAGTSPTLINANPLFVDRVNGDFRLRDNSPCIDVGDPLLAADPDGTVADMGAFFFDQDATSAYCTGKTNSLGCVPFMSWTGFASTTAPQAFRLTAGDVVPGEIGFLLYSFKKANLNYHGGKLCVKAPFQRLLPPKIAGSGGPLPCKGTINRDFNARIQAGTDPLLTPGQRAFAQYRLRDPGDPAGFGDGLTDAVRFTIAP